MQCLSLRASSQPDAVLSEDTQPLTKAWHRRADAFINALMHFPRDYC